MWILQILHTAFTNLNWLDPNKIHAGRHEMIGLSLVATIILLFKVLLFHQIMNWESVLKKKKQVQGHKQGPWQVLNPYWVFLPWKGVSGCLGTLVNTEECKQQASGHGGHLCQRSFSEEETGWLCILSSYIKMEFF